MMKDHLANAMRGYLEANDITAVALERPSSLPNSTIASILRGTHPRSETIGAILTTIAASDFVAAKKILTAYLLDDCPEQWEDKIKIVFAQEASDDIPQPGDRFEAALQGFRRTGQGDADFRAWIIDTAELMQLISKPTNITSHNFTSAEKPAQQQSLRVAEDPKPYGSKPKATAPGGYPQDTNQLDTMPSQHVAQEHCED